jgi:error-prone DNA polymerase
MADRGERPGCSDAFAHGSPGSPDSSERPVPGVCARDMCVPDLHIDTLKIKSRNFQ